MAATAAALAVPSAVKVGAAVVNVGAAAFVEV
jgi:hypothetical protein